MGDRRQMRGWTVRHAGLLAIAIAALVVPLLTGCRGQPGAAEQARGGPAAQAGQGSASAGTEVISIQGYSFQPVEIQVPVGATVVWTNHDAVGHTVFARDGAWGSGLLSQGQQFSRTFTQPGTYDYFCQPHPWMVARITVGQSAVVAASPAPATPASSAGADAWSDQMRRWMEQMHGPGSFDSMLQWMKEHGGSGMMSGSGTMGEGGMMGSR